jgi:hypothetical protein
VTRTQPPGYPHPNSRATTSNRKHTKTARLWLRSCLRHPHEARSPLGFLSLKRANSQQVYPQVGFEYFYSYSIHIRPSHPALDAVSRLTPTFRNFFFSSRMLQSTGTPPHLSVGDLLRLSLTSVWSDVRRHRLLPTRRARRDQRRFSTVCGVTRLTDCASLLFPLHMSHTPLPFPFPALPPTFDLTLRSAQLPQATSQQPERATTCRFGCVKA